MAATTMAAAAAHGLVSLTPVVRCACGWSGAKERHWALHRGVIGIPLTDEERRAAFQRRVVVDESSGCWLWQGPTERSGYGKTSGKWAHRLAFELYRGPIPAGDLDHLCRRPGCVNPWHLEPVSHRENTIRGLSFASKARWTHCPRGHELAGGNVKTTASKPGGRECRTCVNAGAVARRAATRSLR